jgi:hypothetical protein
LCRRGIYPSANTQQANIRPGCPRLPLFGFTLAQQQLDIAVAAGENKIDFTALLFFLFVRLFMSRAAKRSSEEVFI